MLDGGFEQGDNIHSQLIKIKIKTYKTLSHSLSLSLTLFEMWCSMFPLSSGRRPTEINCRLVLHIYTHTNAHTLTHMCTHNTHVQKEREREKFLPAFSVEQRNIFFISTIPLCRLKTRIKKKKKKKQQSYHSLGSSLYLWLPNVMSWK